MLVGRKKEMDEKIVAGANAARESKWAAIAGIKSRAVGAQEVSAAADTKKAEADFGNAVTSRLGQRETRRHNINAEGLESTKIQGDLAHQKSTIGIEKEKNTMQGLKIKQEAPVLAAQSRAYDANAELDSSKSSLVKSGLEVRRQFLNPEATPERRSTIAGLYQAESGAKPPDTRQVVPGQKVAGFDAKGRAVETITNPLVVDESSSTFTEVKPATPQTFSTPEDKLKSKIGTPEQKMYEDEYVKEFGTLPKGYNGRK